MRDPKVTIIKRSGEKVEYDSSKLKHSLERSGASEQVIREVMDKVEASLQDGITTKEIYTTAFSLLRKRARPIAARYKLKKAILELGPTGYPFERFVAEILKVQGYLTTVGVDVKGHCINHEVDVIAETKSEHIMVECKFHSDQGRRCDVKVPLYIHSRFRDVEKKWLTEDKLKSKKHKGCIFTNTRFTDDATRYGRCVDLIMVGWDYPLKGSLKERIDTAGLHPVTCISSLTKLEKQKLLSSNKVLCRDLILYPNILDSLHISSRRQNNVLEEVEGLCNIQIEN
jgi:Holliday junction resolvase-like predicted endonuclease